MSKVYVANLTNQVQDFIYRLPERRSPTRQAIPIGGQVQLSGDLSAPDIEAIVEQHTPYGLVHVREIDKSKTFAGICWQEDKPINIEAIRRGVAHNYEILDARGRVLRQEAAVALTNQLQDGLDPRQGSLNALEVEVVEVEKAGGPEPTVAEGIRVAQEAPQQLPPGAPHARGAASKGGASAKRGGSRRAA